MWGHDRMTQTSPTLRKPHHPRSHFEIGCKSSLFVPWPVAAVDSSQIAYFRGAEAPSEAVNLSMVNQIDVCAKTHPIICRAFDISRDVVHLGVANQIAE